MSPSSASGAPAPMSRSSFDEDYVRRLTCGDPDVERHFTSYFSTLLWMKLRSRLRSPELIRDARQETFLRVLTTLRRKGGLEHPDRLGAFVNAVCNNVLLESYRREARFRAGNDEANDAADRARDPEMAALAEDEGRRVREV